jgi:hypothetical protein
MIPINDKLIRSVIREKTFFTAYKSTACASVEENHHRPSHFFNELSISEKKGTFRNAITNTRYALGR